MRDLQHATRRAEKTKTEAEHAKALVGFTQFSILGLGVILLPFVLARLLRSGIVCVEVVTLAWGGALAGACLSASMVVVVFIAFGSAVVLEKPLVGLIGLSFVLGSVLFGALWYGTRRARNTVDKRVAPNHGIRQSARNAIRLGLLFGVFVLTPNALLFAFVSHTFGIEKTLISVVGWSLVTAINSALVFGGAAVVKHLLLRMILWGVGDAPWNYTRFLDSCGEMGILRNVGGGYIFVHRYLLEYFTGLNE